MKNLITGSLVLFLTFLIIITFIRCVFAEQEWTNDAIADAIWSAEGGLKAQYAYGIRSVKYSSLKEARRICLNTIKNQRKRHANHECGLTYLECLQNRYCPINASNDPQGLNRYWLSNVMYFLEKGRAK